MENNNIIQSITLAKKLKTLVYRNLNIEKSYGLDLAGFTFKVDEDFDQFTVYFELIYNGTYDDDINLLFSFYDSSLKLIEKDEEYLYLDEVNYFATYEKRFYFDPRKIERVKVSVVVDD